MIDIFEDIKDKIVGNEETTENPETESSDDDLLSLKEQIAGQYVEHLKKQKEGGLSDMVIGEGNALKDYLVTEGIGDRISDTIKGELFGKIFGAFDSKSFSIGGVEYASIFDYLKTMKEELNAAKTDIELNALLAKAQTLDQTPDSSVTDGSVAVGTGVGVGVLAAGGIESNQKVSEHVAPLEDEYAKISSKFGPRQHPVTGKEDNHTGIDISAREGTELVSICDGEVVKNRKTKFGGNELIIKGSDGKEYYYLHMKKKSSFYAGDKITKGDVIGYVGSTGRSTGPHLHLTIKENDKSVDPLVVLPEVFGDYPMAA